uniref:Uncharacterized protein n=1 Tax=Glossina austeni TaxID=7395 RepID=A0A1A9V6Q9_GLOAU
MEGRAVDNVCADPHHIRDIVIDNVLREYELDNKVNITNSVLRLRDFNQQHTRATNLLQFTIYLFQSFKSGSALNCRKRKITINSTARIITVAIIASEACIIQ